MVGFVPSVTETGVLTVLRSFLLSILPPGVEVVRGLQNRVPEPKANDFVVMTTILRSRIETNTDTWADVAFSGSISGTTLTVYSGAAGQFIIGQSPVGGSVIGVVAVGAAVFGPNVAPGTVITGLGTGTGGAGTYTVNISQTVAQETMAAGAINILQPTRLTIQLDVHGPNSADNAQTISTLFRDEYAISAFHATAPDVTPLFCEDPKQIPFKNAEDQIETRFVVDAILQANIVVSPPQQYADQLNVSLVEVDTTYAA